MKKVSIFTVLSILLCSVVYADQLQFVTLMSAPVGSFSKVETVTKAKAKNASIYGNTSIQLRGNGNAELGDVVLKENAALTGRVGELSANTLTIQSGGNITGKGLWANTVTMDSATDSNVKVKETLYVENGANVSGAAVWGGLAGEGESDFEIEGKNKMSLEDERAPGNLHWLGNDDKTERLLTSSWGTSSSTQEEEPTYHNCLSAFVYYEYTDNNVTFTPPPSGLRHINYYANGIHHCSKNYDAPKQMLRSNADIRAKQDNCKVGDQFLWYDMLCERGSGVGEPCRYYKWACLQCNRVTSDKCKTIGPTQLEIEYSSASPDGSGGTVPLRPHD